MNIKSNVINKESCKKIMFIIIFQLPYPKEPSRKGDLLVSFDIIFPEKLPTETKDLLRDILPAK